jgi:hypothetical protein
MSFEGAASALQDAANAPEPATPGFESAAPATSVPAPSTEVAPGTTPEDPADSFSNIDPNSLPPELQAQYRNMQADYTRTKQGLAEQYKGIDPERARQSLDFIEALETDPNFVVTVHQQLSKALEDAGMSPAQAAQSAASAIQEQSSLGGDDPDEFGAPDSGLAKEVAELRQWKEAQEAQQYESNLAAHLQRQEMGIRQSDPSLTEPEFDRIYELAFAHGGDLVKAHASYSAWKNDVMSQYIDRKAEVPNVGVPDSSGFAETPRTSFTFDEGHAAASEYLRNAMANS